METIAVVHVIANNVLKRKELFLLIALLIIIIGEILSSGSRTSLRRTFMLNVLFVLQSLRAASMVKGGVARFER